MAYRVLWLQTRQQFDVEEAETVLAAARRQGVDLPHECTFGGCGTCRMTVVDGRVRYDELPMALTEEEHAQGQALACQALPESDLAISMEAPAAASEPARMQARIDELRVLGPGVYGLRLSLPPGHGVAYLPGQYLNIHLEDGGHRSFSMANAPDGCRIDLQIRRIEGGRFTDGALARLGAGDTLKVELPHGAFRYHARDDMSMIFAATGTGLAPVKAIIESLLDSDDCPPCKLYWGVRSQADLYLAEEIAGWADRLYAFEFVPVLSRPLPGWQGRQGYVQDAILHDQPDLSEYALYLCGAPAMIRDATRRFVQAGAQPDRLYSDSFTFQSAPAAAACQA